MRTIDIIEMIKDSQIDLKARSSMLRVIAEVSKKIEEEKKYSELTGREVRDGIIRRIRTEIEASKDDKDEAIEAINIIKEAILRRMHKNVGVIYKPVASVCERMAKVLIETTTADIIWFMYYIIDKK